MEPSLASNASQKESPFRGTGRLFPLGILSASGYAIIALLSGENLSTQNPDSFALTRFLQTYAFLFLCYWFMISPLARGRRMDRRHLWFAISFGFLFRAILFYTPPILDHHIYRCLWDGHTSLQGINPYRYAPLDNETTPYRTDYWTKIDSSQAHTAYPPIPQFVFLVSETLYPGSIHGMKFLFLVLDIAAIFLLMSALEALKRPPEWCLIYAWSPLVVKEIPNSGHVDAIGAFLLALSLLMIVKGKRTSAALSLAALAATQFFAVLLTPLFHREWQGKQYALFLLVAVVLFLPFLAPGVNPLAGSIEFAQESQFNAGLFSIVEFGFRQWGGEAAVHSGLLARLAVLTVVLLTAFWQTLALVWRTQIESLLKAFLVVMGTLLLYSPVVYPWHLVGLIPLLCLFPNRSWTLLTGLVFLSYTFYYDHSLPAWVPWIEYGVFFVAWITESSASPKHWGKIENASMIQQIESPDEPLPPVSIA